MVCNFVLRSINLYKKLSVEDQQYYAKELGLKQSASTMEVERALSELFRFNPSKAHELTEEMKFDLTGE